ncbi:TPA: fimbrial protein [Enterobacter asburiae]|nr:fimbrial protein [Enterobacter asburiae]
MNIFTRISITLLLSSICPLTQAGMTVYPMEISLGTKGADKIRVISQDDNVQFVKVILKKIAEPGTPKEHEIDATAEDKSNFIITPQKLALAAGSERIVRLVSVMQPEKETTWRAYFESVSEDVFNHSEMAPAKGTASANVGVNVIWGALIHVAPKEVIASLKYKNNTSTVVNDGTIRVPVKEIATCDDAGKCRWVKTNITVYPNTDISFPGMTFSSNKHYKIKYINWLSRTTEEISLPAQQVN